MSSRGCLLSGVALNEQLIDCLADGRFHSGEELGRVMGLSRAAIWKHIQHLQDEGLAVESVRGQGYRVPGGIELLRESAIRGHGGKALESLELIIFTETDSTNAQALVRARQPMERPLAVLAERQTAGRGRRGRAWQSPLGRNLYLSLAVPFPFGGSGLEGLSLVAGLAVASALDRLGLPQPVGLKWPNDLWIGGRKVGGILIELAGDLDAASVAVIGVGLNLAPLPDQAAAAVDQPWTDLESELGARPARNRLVASVLDALWEHCQRFAESGFAPFQSAWQSADVLAGGQVTVWLGDQASQGKCLGVSARGALRVNIDGEDREFHGGEVTLREAGK